MAASPNDGYQGLTPDMTKAVEIEMLDDNRSYGNSSAEAEQKKEVTVVKLSFQEYQ